MSAQHTQSLLWLEVVGSSETVIISTIEGYAVAEPCNWGSIADVEQQKANFRRLVACWNRLKKFTTEQIEDLGYDLFADVRPDFERAMRQRDELRDLLSEVSRHFTRNDDLPDGLLPRIDDALDRIGAA